MEHVPGPHSNRGDKPAAAQTAVLELHAAESISCGIGALALHAQTQAERRPRASLAATPATAITPGGEALGGLEPPGPADQNGAGLDEKGVGLDEKGVGLDEKGVGLDEKGVGLENGTGLENGAGLDGTNAGTGKINAGLDEDNAGLNKSGAGLDESGAGLDEGDGGLNKNNAGSGRQKAGLDKTDAGLDMNNARLDTNNARLDTNNAGLDTNNARLDTNNAGLDTNNARLDTNNAGLDMNGAGSDQSNVSLNKNNAGPDKTTDAAPENSASPDETLSDTPEHMEPFDVPAALVSPGLVLLKVSPKLKKKIRLWVEPASFQFVYRQVSKNSTHSFHVDDIRSITPRQLASHYRRELGFAKDAERRWVSIAFFDHRKNKTKLLHLVADSAHDAKRLLHTVGQFKSIKDRLAADFLVDLKDLDAVKRSLLSGKAEHAGRAAKQLLTFAEVLRYCQRLGINVHEARLQALFAHVTPAPAQHMGFADFKRFVELLTRRDDIARVYAGLVGAGHTLGLDAFCRFATATQHEPPDRGALAATFRHFAGPAAAWSVDAFAAYLKLPQCAASRQQYLRADYYAQPLNEYFILLSHNTYLTGRQVAGGSSVEGYVRALQRGCRCLEIDVWNNPADAGAEPIVNHGRTFTSGILLSNVLATVRRFAFQASPFPLILSLEVHCCPRAQELVAQILEDVFGAALVLRPLDSRGVLPSPAALRHRVLVKVKKTSAFAGAVDEHGRFATSSTTHTSSAAHTSVSDGERAPGSRFKIRRRPAGKVCARLSDLAVYCQGLKFRNFSLPELKTYNHCFSLSETAANAMLRDPAKTAALDKHNRRFLMRVYPAKTRLRSSNLLPPAYWAHGVQMVATNWQTYDLGQQLNEAFFATAPGRGYVLKPPALRRPPMKASMRRPPPDVHVRFRIDVLGAQQLPKPPAAASVCPFVTVELVGAAALDWAPDLAPGATPVVPDNGFNPTWNLRFSGRLRAATELVFLRLTIHTSAARHAVESPKEIALLVTHLFDLKQGYRHLPLKDLCGETLEYSSLFVYILYGPA